MGAHSIERWLDGVVFNVRVAKPGQSRARIMRWTIKLTPADLYDVSIGFLERRTFDWYSLVDVEAVDYVGMVQIMRDLAVRA